MKRSECTVESLKALGYEAKVCDEGSWRMKATVRECNERQAAEVFEIVAAIVRGGGHVEIGRNNMKYTVNIYVDKLDFTNTIGRDRFFLSRPMTEAERLEADLYTGRGKDWVEAE